MYSCFRNADRHAIVTIFSISPLISLGTAKFDESLSCASKKMISEQWMHPDFHYIAMPQSFFTRSTNALELAEAESCGIVLPKGIEIVRDVRNAIVTINGKV